MVWCVYVHGVCVCVSIIGEGHAMVIWVKITFLIGRIYTNMFFHLMLFLTPLLMGRPL